MREREPKKNDGEPLGKSVMDAEQDRSNGYEAHAPAFMAHRSRSLIGAAEVRRWSRALPAAAEVLDAGCGHGIPISQALLEAGCRVWGIDASPALVSAFRARFPDVPIECGPVEESALFQRTFHGVVAWGLVFLLAPEVQVRVLEKLSGALKPGGHLLFTAPEPACTWVDVLTGQPSESLGAEAYERILGDLGMDLRSQTRDEGDNHYYRAVKR